MNAASRPKAAHEQRTHQGSEPSGQIGASAVVLLRTGATYEGVTQVAGGVVTLAGSLRRVSGSEIKRTVRYGPLGTWTWPLRQVREVRWLRGISP